MKDNICVDIHNEIDIVTARKQGRELAKNLGFGLVDQARITTAISELARNIFLYAGQGQISLKKIQENQKIGLEMKASDHGPGIPCIRTAMQDGYTTSKGLGAGLPGVKRLMDVFSIHSSPSTGTEITGIKWLK